MPVIFLYYKKESRITIENGDIFKFLKLSFSGFTYCSKVAWALSLQEQDSNMCSTKYLRK